MGEEYEDTLTPGDEDITEDEKEMNRMEFISAVDDFVFGKVIDISRNPVPDGFKRDIENYIKTEIQELQTQIDKLEEVRIGFLNAEDCTEEERADQIAVIEETQKNLTASMEIIAAKARFSAEAQWTFQLAKIFANTRMHFLNSLQSDLDSSVSPTLH